jgi:hypothetical protein
LPKAETLPKESFPPPWSFFTFFSLKANSYRSLFSLEAFVLQVEVHPQKGKRGKGNIPLTLGESRSRMGRSGPGLGMIKGERSSQLLAWSFDSLKQADHQRANRSWQLESRKDLY